MLAPAPAIGSVARRRRPSPARPRAAHDAWADAGVAAGVVRVSRAAAWFAGAASATVLAGWLLGSDTLKAWVPGETTMKTNAALGTLALALALILGVALPRVAGAFAAAAGVVGLLTGIETASGRRLGIDQLLFSEPAGAVHTTAPNQMSPNVAALIVLLAAALLLTPRRGRLAVAGQVCAIAAVVGSLLALVGWVTGADQLLAVGKATHLSLPAALTLLALSVAAVFLRLDLGLARRFVATGFEGMVLRLSLGAALVVPIGLGAVRNGIERAGVDVAAGQWLYTVAVVVVLAGWSVVAAQLIGRSAGVTERAERQLLLLNRRLEHRVDQRTAELSAANDELRAFSYSISHDLRTPLRALDGFSQALLEDYGPGLDDTARDYLGRIRAASQRLAALIDDVLALSRVTRSELRRGTVDVTRLGRAVAAELAAADPAREIDLRIDDGIAVEADETLLRVVVQNLLENAWKFTAATPAPVISLTACELDGVPGFRVEDNGAGFPEEHAAKLFKPFQRLHSSREFPGNGIGLATVLNIVKRHGGNAVAESTAGEGARFTVTFAGPGAAAPPAGVPPKGRA